jgi:hypothetical protein
VTTTKTTTRARRLTTTSSRRSMQFISRAFQYFPRKFLLEPPRVLAVFRSSRTRIFHASGAWKRPRHTCPYLFTSRLSFAWCSYSGTPRETPHLTSLFWASRTAEHRLCVLAFVSQHSNFTGEVTKPAVHERNYDIRAAHCYDKRQPN